MVHGEARLDETHDRVVRIALLTGVRELTPDLEARIERAISHGYDNHAAAEWLRQQLACSSHNTEAARSP